MVKTITSLKGVVWEVLSENNSIKDFPYFLLRLEENKDFYAYGTRDDINSVWGFPVDQFGEIGEVLNHLKMMLDYDLNIEDLQVRQMYVPASEMEKQFIKVLENI